MRPIRLIVCLMLAVSLFYCSHLGSIKQKISGSAEETKPVEYVSIPDSLLADQDFERIKTLHSQARTALAKKDTALSILRLEEALKLLSEKEESDINIDADKDFLDLFTMVVKDYRELIAQEAELASDTPPDMIQDEIDRELDDSDEVLKNPSAPSLSHFPIVVNSKVERIIKFYQTRGKKSMQLWLERSSKYLPLLTKIVHEMGLPEELAYLPMIESGFNPRAYSRAHAVGFWQFISSTGKRYGLKRDSFVDDRKDPVKSTYAGLKHLKDLFNQHKDWYIALANYNCSPRRINKAIRRSGTRDYWKLSYLPRETKNYIPKFIAAVLIARNPEKYGFKDVSYQPEWKFDEVELENSVDLFVAAKCAETTRYEILKFNPQLLSNVTPPDKTGFILRIPEGKKEIFEQKLSEIPKSQWVTKIDYRVRRGDTLSTIARKFKSKIDAIQRINGIRNKHRLSIGQRLIIPVNMVTNVRKIYQANSSVPASIPGMKKVIYTVKHGDTLGEIAETYHTRASSIRRWNGLSYGRYIYPKQKLVIWTKKSSPNRNTSSAGRTIAATGSESSDKNVYTIKGGDTIYWISKEFNVNINDIKSWNPGIDVSKIYPGQKIYIKYSNSGGN